MFSLYRWKLLIVTFITALIAVIIIQTCSDECVQDVRRQREHSLPFKQNETSNPDAMGKTLFPSERQAQRMNEAETNTNTEQLFVAVSFEEIMKTVVFMAVTWSLGKASLWMGMPSLVGEIVTGFVLGPPLADFVPFPQAMVLIGNFGLIGLLLQSGIDFDVAQLKESGTRAFFLAVTGSLLALLSGFGIGFVNVHDAHAALAIGAAFCPSSLGVASNVLSSGDVLNTPIGQLIVASSVVDDVIGLFLLSILQVLVQDSARAIDYIVPFLSSFGFLIVLGFSGITWLPRFLERKVLPLFPESHRASVALGLVFLLLIGYMPLLYYTKASFLTGAFLTGLSFSQIHSVHALFSKHGQVLLTWLMRIFFAATIGFQVPVRYFGQGAVVRWGFFFLIPVIAKVPLGFFVQRFRHQVADDFPYDPYWRDFLVTALAMCCRGEFNFIIASFALTEGLLDQYTYSAVVLAVLMSSMVFPLALSKVIQYYNNKTKDYMEGKHPTTKMGNDQYRPLFVAIQARTHTHWGLHHSMKKALEDAGLVIIDHRSWHTLGLDSVDITEIFAQDTTTKVKLRSRIPHVHQKTPSTEQAVDVSAGRILSDLDPKPLDLDSEQEIRVIVERCEEIRTMLSKLLLNDDPKDYAIQVSQWQTHNFDSTVDHVPQFYHFGYCPSNLSAVSSHNVAEEEEHESVASIAKLESYHEHHDPQLSQYDLWDSDTVTLEVVREGYFMSPCAGEYSNVVYSGADEGRRSRSATADSNNIFESRNEMDLNVIKERLHGYVRS